MRNSVRIAESTPPASRRTCRGIASTSAAPTESNCCSLRSRSALEQAEDQIKAQVRENLRALALARESYRIQELARDVAQRRVDSSEMFLQAGRVQIRDGLEAQEALLNARKAVTAVTVNYRLAELALQRDLAVLEVDDEGRWREYDGQE